jgi:cytochrome c553
VGAPDSSAPGKPRPLCGDCHGGHSIPSKTDSASIEAIRSSALEMCGKCHVQAASTYADYYHGAAYRKGAKDAPACWQCHNTHLILPSANRLSWSSPDNLLTTCGQCHKGTLNDQYTSYAKLVHRKSAVLSENPVFVVANSARQAISNAFYQVAQVFRRNGS